jgi:putative DNA primase/helicase
VGRSRVSVFPVQVFATEKGKIEKVPRVKWRDLSTTDSETIKSWWKQWPDSLPGIDLAKIGVVVLDGDRHGGPDGVAGLAQLFKEHNLDTSAIPIVVTLQNGGRHAWFKQPTDLNGSEPLGNRDRAIRDSGINVRGHGGFVVAPGAKFRSNQYQRCHGTPSTIEAFRNGTIPVLPPSLVELLQAEATAKPESNAAATPTPTPVPKPNGSSHHRAPPPREEAYADTALRNTINELAAMPPESGRNIELNTAALKMGHQVAAGRIDRATVEKGLYDASVANGLVKDTSANAVRATIASGLNTGIKEPSPPLQDRPLTNGGSYKATLKTTTAAFAAGTGELLSVCAADVKMKIITWLWPDRFAIGKLGLIVGLPDEGKGQILSFFCAAVTTGGNWPMDEGRAPQGNVILFSDEDDPNDTLVPRLAAAGADLGRVHIIKMVRHDEQKERLFSLVTDLEALRKKISGVGDVKLVVIDPITAYLGFGTVDSFRTADVRAVLTPLVALAAEMKVAIIAVMHFNKKMDVTNALLRISDSLAFGAVARHVYGVIDDSENRRKLFVRAKNNVSARSKNQTLAYQFGAREVGKDEETGQSITAPYILWEPNYIDVTASEAMQAVAENRSLRTRDDAKQLLADHVVADKGILVDKLKEIAEANGISWITMRRAKNDLGIVAEKDNTTPDGPWYWKRPGKRENTDGDF